MVIAEFEKTLVFLISVQTFEPLSAKLLFFFNIVTCLYLIMKYEFMMHFIFLGSEHA